MSEQSMESRVRSLIVLTLGLPPEAAAGELQMSNPPAWDSLGHMTLVAALEKEFEVRFPIYAIPELTNVPAIVRKLEEQQRG